MSRFSTFPSGVAGLGLLLLRVAVAAALLVHGAACLPGSERSLGASAVGAMTALSGTLLLIGLVTPQAAVLAALGSAGLAASWLPSPAPSPFAAGLMSPLVVLVASAIAMLGPGAFSLDAVLFGRREITIPPRRQLPAED